MGNKKKADKWLPTDPLRVKGFVRLLAAELYGHDTTTKPRVIDLLSGIENHNNVFSISPTTLRNWVNGEDIPSKSYQNLIEKISLNPLEPLKQSINSSPILRFLCALDICGSNLNSPARTLDKVTEINSAGACLNEIAKLWAPHELELESGMYCYIIPKLKTSPSEQTGYIQYRAYDRFSILEFMFNCGAVIDFNEADFEDWTIDIATATLLIKTSIDVMPTSLQSLSGDTRDLSNLIYAVFFNTNNVFYEKRLSRYLARKYPIFSVEISNNYVARFISARKVLEKKLLTFGCNLSIANELSKKCTEKDLAFQKVQLDDRPFEPQLFRHLTEDDSLLERTIKTDYTYTFKIINDERIVTFKDAFTNTETALPLRNDLFDDYPESTYIWGYTGTGVQLLAISIIAHHLGHDVFNFKKASYLVDKYLSKYAEPHHLRTFHLRTNAINECIN